MNSMSNKEQFQLVYDGPALDSSEMDIKNLAPALLAIGDLLEESNKVLYGSASQVQVNVKGSFKTGSFLIELAVLQSIWKQLVDFACSPTGNTCSFLMEIVGFSTSIGLIQLLKRLKNRPIKKVTKQEGSTTTIEVDDELIRVEDQVIELYRNSRIRSNLELLITKPLERDGVETVAIHYRDSWVQVVSSEKEYFRAPVVGDEILKDTTEEAHLQIVSVTFQEDNKWRFSMGAGSFYAEMQDKDYIKQVQESRVSFTKGDILNVMLRTKQFITNSEMKTEYYVIKVLNQRSASKQIPLPI